MGDLWEGADRPLQSNGVLRIVIGILRCDDRIRRLAIFDLIDHSGQGMTICFERRHGVRIIPQMVWPQTAAAMTHAGYHEKSIEVVDGTAELLLTAA
jgi:hypothetical protein